MEYEHEKIAEYNKFNIKRTRQSNSLNQSIPSDEEAANGISNTL